MEYSTYTVPRMNRALLQGQKLLEVALVEYLVSLVERTDIWNIQKQTLNTDIQCRIWGSHSGSYEEFCRLGYNAV
jgi:hypothetical protein